MAAQKWVEIRHPDIEKTAVVAAVSLPHHRKAGWEVVESTQQPPAQPQTDRQAQPLQPRPQNRPPKPEKNDEPEGTA